jgi:hypothetical protein
MRAQDLQHVDDAVEWLVRLHLAGPHAAPAAVSWRPGGPDDRTLMFHPSAREQRWIVIASATPPAVTAAAQLLFPVEDEPYTAFCRSGADCEERWRRKGSPTPLPMRTAR